MNNATESASQAPPAPAAERAATKESQRLDWLIVGLDVPDLEQARPLVQTLAGRVGALKIGPVLFTRAGAAAIDLVHEHGGRVFLDLKWHDTPNTVAGACRAAAEQGVWMVNVHAAGGERMLAAAREALEQAQQPGIARPLLIAVTVLTSLDAADLPATGVTGPVAEQVERLAALAERGGADGLVHLRPRGSGAARPLAALQHGRSRYPPSLVHLRRPRPRGRSAPRRHSGRHALAAGASHVVIARPIITHRDPQLAVRLTEQEVTARADKTRGGPRAGAPLGGNRCQIVYKGKVMAISSADIAALIDTERFPAGSAVRSKLAEAAGSRAQADSRDRQFSVFRGSCARRR